MSGVDSISIGEAFGVIKCTFSQLLTSPENVRVVLESFTQLTQPLQSALVTIFFSIEIVLEAGESIDSKYASVVSRLFAAASGVEFSSVLNSIAIAFSVDVSSPSGIVFEPLVLKTNPTTASPSTAIAQLNVNDRSNIAGLSSDIFFIIIAVAGFVACCILVLVAFYCRAKRDDELAVDSRSAPLELGRPPSERVEGLSHYFRRKEDNPNPEMAPMELGRARSTRAERFSMEIQSGKYDKFIFRP